MTNLKAYVVSDSNDGILVANMTELQAKDAKIKALEDEVRDLTTRFKSLISELNKAERKAYSGLGD
jgi:chaperonin cofactor prefoldin